MDRNKLQMFQIGVKGIIVNRRRETLVMLKTVNGKTFWDVPGGRMEKEETIEQALHRELKEEVLNIKSFQIGRVLSVDIIKGIDTVENIDLLLVFYKVESDLDDVVLSEEHQSYRWVSIDEIDYLEKEAPIKSGIKEALKISLER